MVNNTFQAGSRLTAAALNKVLIQPAFVVTDQVINSGTSANITGLSWAVSAGTFLLQAAILGVQGVTTAQQAVGIAGPTATMVAITFSSLDTTASSSTVAWGGTTLTAMGTRGSLGQVGNIDDTHSFTTSFDGMIVFSASGTFSLTASTVTSPSDVWTVKAGSFAALLQVA